MPRSSFRSLLVAGGLVLVAVALMTGLAAAQNVGGQSDGTTTTTKAPVTTTTHAPATTTTHAPETTTTTHAPVTTTTTAPAVATVTPIIECSYKDTRTGRYYTVWGYENNTGKEISVPVGTQNSFDNPSANAGQPTTFKVGRVQNVFYVNHSGSSTWKLTGKTATAPGKACTSPPVPVVAEGLGGLVVFVLVTLLMGIVLFWRFGRSARRVRPRRD